ncbi:MAG: efflux RND transporter periplasmic adaptor subunit [candidate division Zixibacteria bacterium]|nr:efflux RND transporter periplasmic adaptor subunit [candidate division Zixibacteria bacterium]
MLSKYSIPGILFIVIIICTGCGGSNDNSKEFTSDPVTVSTVQSKIGDIKITKLFGGNVEGIEQSDVYARIPEVVENVNVKLGERVKIDQILVTLDKKGPNSKYLQAQAAFENARKDFKRMEFLYLEKAISEQRFDQSRMAFKVAEADYIAASALVELKSPIDGVVTAISVTLGQPAIIGKPLVTVANIEQVLIKLIVGAKDASKVKIDSEVNVMINSNDAVPVKGVVHRVSESADPGTRGFEIEVVADNKNGMFKPGTYAKVELVMEQHKKVVLVGSVAIFIREGRSYVFKNVNGRAILTPIETGGESGGMTYIQSGIQTGEDVITAGSNLVVNNDSINVVEGF